MKRIVLDMDEVLTDFCKKDIAVYNAIFHKTICKEDVYGKTLDEYDPQSKTIMDALRATPNYFSDLDVKEGAQEGVRRLMQHYEVFIATAAMEWPESFAAKYAWLRCYFPFVPDTNYVLCGDKSILHADYMVDDSPRNVYAFHGEALMYRTHHNEEVVYERVVHNWDEICEYFEGLL